jgi:hypothetical protein
MFLLLQIMAAYFTAAAPQDAPHEPVIIIVD